MNHLTGMILPRGEEHVAWRCLGIGKGVRRRPRVKSTRPTVGQIGSPGALRRLPDAKASRGAPRLPGKPICSHQIDSYLFATALADQDLFRGLDILEFMARWIERVDGAPIIATGIADSEGPDGAIVDTAANAERQFAALMIF